MKRLVLLLGLAILAAGMMVGQDAASSGSQDQNTQTRSRTTSNSSNVIRGCLSGSTGNYTVTDRNGMQYTVNGDDATLRSMVGREVEITLSEDHTADSSQTGGTTTQTSNTVQASDVRAVSSTCTDAGTTP